MRKLLVTLALLATPGVALAQAGQCRLPDRITRPAIEGPDDNDPKRVLPIGGYTLAISWSPQYCSGTQGDRSAFQCDGTSGRFDFTLHGLWPDGVGKLWPQYCRPADLVPRAVIRDTLCATPSAQLIQHEWAKHGTCMATTPQRYFTQSRALYQSIRYPDMGTMAQRKSLTVDQFAAAFARANRGLRPDMLRVTTTRDGRLSEIWLCLDRARKFTRCPAHHRGAPGASILRIEPLPAD